MVTDWSVRNEILSASHRWPVIVLFCLVGSLLGWMVSWVWPTPLRATTELYVAINISQALDDKNAAAHAGVEFNYPDDYKNWQMQNLNALLYTDDVIHETLGRLRAQNAAWTNVSREELIAMLQVYWRNAGRWRLVAESRNWARADEAVTTWRDVILEKMDGAIRHAQVVMELDREITALSASTTQAQARLAQLNRSREILQGWKKNAESGSNDRPLEPVERQQLGAAVSTAHLNPNMQPALPEIPPAGSPVKDVLAWLDLAQAGLDQEIQWQQAQATTLTQQLQDLNTQYTSAAQKSRGFSPNIEIEKLSDAPPLHTVVRPTGLLMLTGAIFGLLAWMIGLFAQVSLKSRQ